MVIALASKQTEEKRLRDQIAEVQKRVSATPRLEAELTALTRDYDTIRRGYESLLAKQEDSKVAAALEQRQIGEYLQGARSRPAARRALQPEPAADQPRWAPWPGSASGLGLVALLEYKDKGLRSEDDVLSVLRLPVLAAIPGH